MDEGFASITGGAFAGNESAGLGGAIYIDEGAEVEMLYVLINDNKASGQGGGIYNCPTGGGEYQRFCGMTLYGNEANNDGDDFFSEKKLNDSGEYMVYVSQYTLNGSKIDWYTDTLEEPYKEGDEPADKAYYQDSLEKMGLKSGASLTDKDESEGIAKVRIYNNTASAGGGIANNGTLRIGYSGLVIEKQVIGLGAPWSDEFEFTVDFSDGGSYDNIASGDKITLRAWERKIIRNILPGVTVTVTESDKPNYAAVEREKSVIMYEHDETLTFINIYFPDTSESPEIGSLTVTKSVTGNAGNRFKDFTFTVALSDDSINGTYGEMDFVDGVASFTLRHNQSKTAENLPKEIRQGF